MNIIFVASLFRYTTAISLIRSFRKLGHAVKVLSDVPSDYEPELEIVSDSFDLIDYIERNELCPDLVFFCEGGTMKLFPKNIHKVTCLTAWYGIDTHMDLDKHKFITRFFDITFLAQKCYVSDFQQSGISNVNWLPLAYDQTLASPGATERVYDISYVGSFNRQMHPDRFQLIDLLRQRFPNSKFTSANARDMYEIYANSKIVFNKSVNNDVNMRFFEAIGSGACVVTNEIHSNGLEELFEEGRHYFVYQNNTILEQVQTILSDYKFKPEQMKEYVSMYHTYDCRVEAILSIVGRSSIARQCVIDTDYIFVFMLLENYSALLLNISTFIDEALCQGSLKRKALFLPVRVGFQIASLLLKLKKAF